MMCRQKKKDYQFTNVLALYVIYFMMNLKKLFD